MPTSFHIPPALLDPTSPLSRLLDSGRADVTLWTGRDAGRYPTRDAAVEEREWARSVPVTSAIEAIRLGMTFLLEWCRHPVVSLTYERPPEWVIGQPVEWRLQLAEIRWREVTVQPWVMSRVGTAATECALILICQRSGAGPGTFHPGPLLRPDEGRVNVSRAPVELEPVEAVRRLDLRLHVGALQRVALRRTEKRVLCGLPGRPGQPEPPARAVAVCRLFLPVQLDQWPRAREVSEVQALLYLLQGRLLEDLAECPASQAALTRYLASIRRRVVRHPGWTAAEDLDREVLEHLWRSYTLPDTWGAFQAYVTTLYRTLPLNAAALQSGRAGQHTDMVPAWQAALDHRITRSKVYYLIRTHRIPATGPPYRLSRDAIERMKGIVAQEDKERAVVSYLVEMGRSRNRRAARQWLRRQMARGRTIGEIADLAISKQVEDDSPAQGGTADGLHTQHRHREGR